MRLVIASIPSFMTLEKETGPSLTAPPTCAIVEFFKQVTLTATNLRVKNELD
jgi:hypothetical protein